MEKDNRAFISGTDQSDYLDRTRISDSAKMELELLLGKANSNEAKAIFNILKSLNDIFYSSEVHSGFNRENFLIVLGQIASQAKNMILNKRSETLDIIAENINFQLRRLLKLADKIDPISQEENQNAKFALVKRFPQTRKLYGETLKGIAYTFNLPVPYMNVNQMWDAEFTLWIPDSMGSKQRRQFRLYFHSPQGEKPFKRKFLLKDLKK